MGLRADFDELVKYWPNYPFSIKVLLIVTTFISALSIGSIAKYLIEFGNFINAGIELYNRFIEPCRVWVSDLSGITFSKSEANVFLIYSLYCTSFIKGIPNSDERKNIILTWFVMAISASLLYFVLRDDPASTIATNVANYYAVFVFVGALITVTFHSALQLGRRNNVGYLYVLISCSIFIAPILLLAIFAAFKIAFKALF